MNYRMGVGLIIACFAGMNCFAQHYFYNEKYMDPPVVLEMGIAVGGMNCLTDLGGKSGAGKPFIKDLNVSNTRLCGTLYLHALYKYAVAVRLAITAGSLYASDAELKHDNSIAINRYRRNLHFRSIIRELSLCGEWHIVSQLMQSRLDRIPGLSPFFCGGITMFQFNPEAQKDNRWFALQQLRTEGQGFAGSTDNATYKLLQLACITGVGMRYEVSARWNMHVLLLHRILFTDYLDDVSHHYIDPQLFDRHLDASTAQLARQLADRRKELQPTLEPPPYQPRGNPSRNDCYFTCEIGAGFVMNRRRR
jgi:hypothetical protein